MNEAIYLLSLDVAARPFWVLSNPTLSYTLPRAVREGHLMESSHRQRELVKEQWENRVVRFIYPTRRRLSGPPAYPEDLWTERAALLPARAS